MAVKNRAVSTLARLKNQAKTEGINYQMCLPVVFSGRVPAEAFTLEIQGEPGTEGGNAYIYAYRF